MVDIPQGMVAVDGWLGRAKTVLDPASMQYHAKVAPKGAKDCAGCCFRGQSSKTCMLACALAARAGQPDCEDRDEETGRTHVYVLNTTDPRQLSLIEK